MNVSRYVSGLCKGTNALLRTVPFRTQVTTCAVRRPNFLCLRSWLGSRNVSIIVRRHLQLKAGKKNLFSGRHKMDKVPKDFSVIYNSNLGPWFIFFRIGTGMTCGVMAVAFYNVIPEISIEFFGSAKGFFLSASSFILVVFTIAFSVAARRFFTRIYYHMDSGNFIGVRRDLFGRLKQLKYTLEDVQPSEIPTSKMSDGWESTIVNIKGHKMQLHGKYFISPAFYNLHIGDTSSESELVQEPKF